MPRAIVLSLMLAGLLSVGLGVTGDCGGGPSSRVESVRTSTEGRAAVNEKALEVKDETGATLSGIEVYYQRAGSPDVVFLVDPTLKHNVALLAFSEDSNSLDSKAQIASRSFLNSAIDIVRDPPNIRFFSQNGEATDSISNPPAAPKDLIH